MSSIHMDFVRLLSEPTVLGESPLKLFVDLTKLPFFRSVAGLSSGISVFLRSLVTSFFIFFLLLVSSCIAGVLCDVVVTAVISEPKSCDLLCDSSSDEGSGFSDFLFFLSFSFLFFFFFVLVSLFCDATHLSLCSSDVPIATVNPSFKSRIEFVFCSLDESSESTTFVFVSFSAFSFFFFFFFFFSVAAVFLSSVTFSVTGSSIVVLATSGRLSPNLAGSAVDFLRSFKGVVGFTRIFVTLSSESSFTPVIAATETEFFFFAVGVADSPLPFIFSFPELSASLIPISSARGECLEPPKVDAIVAFFPLE